MESFCIEEPSSTLCPLPSQYLSSAMRSHLDDDRNGLDYYYYFEGCQGRAMADMTSRLGDGNEMDRTTLCHDYGSYAVYTLSEQTSSFLPFIARSESISTAMTSPKNRAKKTARFSDHLASVLYFRSSLPVLNLLDANHVSSLEPGSTLPTLPLVGSPSLFSMPPPSPDAVNLTFQNFSLDDLRRSSLSLRLLSSPCSTVALEKLELVFDPLLLSLASALAPRPFLVGSILVRNIRYEKKVFVRLSFDNWMSFNDYPAYYVKSFRRGEIDAFDFRVPVIEAPQNGGCTLTACFAVCYQVGDTQYWDNNAYNNYQIQIEWPSIAKASHEHPIHDDDDSGACFFPFIDMEADSGISSVTATALRTASGLFTAATSAANFQPVALSKTTFTTTAP